MMREKLLRHKIRLCLILLMWRITEHLDLFQLEVSNGNKYPENENAPSTQMSRVFRDVDKYSYTENEYQGGDTLLNRANVSTIFSFIYFDLRNQKLDIKDGVTRLHSITS